MFDYVLDTPMDLLCFHFWNSDAEKYIFICFKFRVSFKNLFIPNDFKFFDSSLRDQEPILVNIFPIILFPFMLLLIWYHYIIKFTIYNS